MNVFSLRAARIAAATAVSAGLLAPGAIAAPPEPPSATAEIENPGTITTFKKGPIDVTFNFTSNYADASYECSLERGETLIGSNSQPLMPCSSPATYTISSPRLDHGKKRKVLFSFFVRASSPEAGQPNPDPEVARFYVVRKPKPKACRHSVNKPKRCAGPGA